MQSYPSGGRVYNHSGLPALFVALPMAVSRIACGDGKSYKYCKINDWVILVRWAEVRSCGSLTDMLSFLDHSLVTLSF